MRMACVTNLWMCYGLKLRLPGKPALIGRDREIRQLQQHLSCVLNGKGKTVFIFGEAGIGKTRLVHEFLNLEQKRSPRETILSGWCLSEANIPYFPFKEALNAYVSAITDEKAKVTMMKNLAITEWLPDARPTHESQVYEFFATPEINRDRTFEVVARVILQLAAQAPLILFLEDLHWADHLSLALLHYLSRKSKNSRLLIIGTYRPEELIPTQAEQLHSLEKTMSSMSLEGLLSKMELKRLKREDFHQLLGSIFRSSITETFEEELYQETEGNPLFIIETLNMLIDEGHLVEREGCWMLTDQMERFGIPSKVHEVITRRVSRIEHEKRKLLDLAAVCGASFTPDILSRVLNLDIVNVLEVLGELENRHRIIRSNDSAFEFTHHRIREVIYENLSSELRRIYHQKTASCLDQALTEKVLDNHMVEVAFHYAEGGITEKAFEYLIKLGEKAIDISANVQAIKYLDKALEATQKNAQLTTSANLAKIHKLRGAAWLQQGEQKKAVSELISALRHAIDINDESIIADAHFLLGRAYIHIEKFSPYFTEASEVMEHLTTALETARKIHDKTRQVKTLRVIGNVLIAKLDTMDEGRKLLEESSKVSQELGDKITEASAREYLGWYHNWKGDFYSAKKNLNKALAIIEELEIVQREPQVLWFLSIVLAGMGDYNDAISAAQKSLQLSQDFGQWMVASWVLNTLGWIYHDLSNIDLASRYNRKSIEIAKKYEKGAALGGVPHAQVNLGLDALYNGDLKKAEENFEEVTRSFHQHPLGWWRLKLRNDIGLGRLALIKGDYVRALKFAEDSLITSRNADSKKYIAKSLKLKAEAFSGMDKIEAAIELMKSSLRIARQIGNPPSIWQILYSLGLLHEKDGDAEKANECYAQAIALIEAVAAKLNHAVLKTTFLASPETRAIRDSYARTISTPRLKKKAAILDEHESVNITANFSVPGEFTPGEQFQVKLDLVNVGKKPGLLVRVEGFAPRKCEVLNVPSYCALEDGSLNMKGRRLDPLSTESIKVWMKVTGIVGVSLSPQVVYVDELGNFRTVKVEEVKILPVVGFESEVSHAVFNYLIDAFVEDHSKQMLTVEKSGWRSLPQIIKGTGVPKRSLYGHGGRLGSRLSELRRKGLIDLKTFRGERGRGGHVLRARIHHEKELVRRYVKEKIPDFMM